MNQMPCSATWLERVTDAGTRPLIPVRPVEEDERDRPAEVKAEVQHILRVIAGLTRDIGPDGTARSIQLDTEVAADVIDNSMAVRELVQLVCARKTGAFTVTDQQIVDVIERAVLQAINGLADARVAA
jgi:hypothetical protein